MYMLLALLLQAGTVPCVTQIDECYTYAPLKCELSYDENIFKYGQTVGELCTRCVIIELAGRNCFIEYNKLRLRNIIAENSLSRCRKKYRKLRRKHRRKIQ